MRLTNPCAVVVIDIEIRDRTQRPGARRFADGDDERANERPAFEVEISRLAVTFLVTRVVRTSARLHMFSDSRSVTSRIDPALRSQTSACPRSGNDARGGTGQTARCSTRPLVDCIYHL
jgi:hypothetical protein